MIVSVTKSPVKNKRFRVLLKNGRHYDFGLLGGSTYIDHHDKKLRDAYWKRHYANPTEKKLIDGFIDSPALFSAYLLWGDSTNLDKNIRDLNHLMNSKN
jgi:hypothetical protein